MHWLAHLLHERHEHTWKGSFSLSWCLKFTNLHEEQRERSRSLLIRWTIKTTLTTSNLSKRLELRPGSCKASMVKKSTRDRPFFVSISGVAFCAILWRDGKQLREDSGKLLEKPLRCLDLASLCSQYEFGLCKHVKVNINSVWEHPTAAERRPPKKYYRKIYIFNILWIITRLRGPLQPTLPLNPVAVSNVKCARLWHMLETLDVARLFLWRMASNLSEICRYETVF